MSQTTEKTPLMTADRKAKISMKLSKPKSISGSLDETVGSSHEHEEVELVEKEEDDMFVYSKGLTSQEAAILLKKYGRNELPDKTIPKWYIFLSLLWQPMPLMIWIAAIIEFFIENDMYILLFSKFIYLILVVENYKNHETV